MTTITVEISDAYVRTLSQWASVARTLNNAISDLRAFRDGKPSTDYEDVSMHLEELRDIAPSLDHLHQMVRSQLWKQQAPKPVIPNVVIRDNRKEQP